MGRIKEAHKYRVKHHTRKGKCRLIDNGKPCTRATHCRGLCAKHHTRLLRQGTINKWAAPQKFSYFKKTVYSVKKNPPLDGCRLKENDKGCKNPLHGRGLCARHYLVLGRYPAYFEKYATKSQKAPRIFSVKKNPKPSVCRMIENYKGCTNAAKSQGLCSKHYLRFHRYGGLKKYGKRVSGS